MVLSSAHRLLSRTLVLALLPLLALAACKNERRTADDDDDSSSTTNSGPTTGPGGSNTAAEAYCQLLCDCGECSSTHENCVVSFLQEKSAADSLGCSVEFDDTAACFTAQLQQSCDLGVVAAGCNFELDELNLCAETGGP
jgi:hypothetical protein